MLVKGTERKTQVLPTALTSLPDFLWDKKLAPVIDTKRLAIIHYQSGHTRATSAFADCDAVLFVGYFSIPPSVIEAYNRVNRSKVTQVTYLMAEVVQAIYRSRIRLGQPVSVYVSSDYPLAFVDAVLQQMDAHDEQGKPLSVYYWGRDIERTLAPLSKIQRRIVETLLERYPTFADTWTLSLPQKEAMALLDYHDSRNMRQVLEHLAATGIVITLS